MNPTFSNAKGEEYLEDMHVLEALTMGRVLPGTIQYIELDSNLAQEFDECDLEDWDVMSPRIVHNSWGKADGLITFHVITTWIIAVE